MFSKACEYGIRASIFIAVSSSKGDRVSLKTIAEHINSPEAFTAKILQILARHKIITSIRGIQGGFEIDSRQMESILLGDIVTAIDGDAIYNGCALGLNKCSETHPCPVHNDFVNIRNGLKMLLETANLKSLANDVNSGNAFLRE